MSWPRTALSCLLVAILAFSPGIRANPAQKAVADNGHTGQDRVLPGASQTYCVGTFTLPVYSHPASELLLASQSQARDLLADSRVGQADAYSMVAYVHFSAGQGRDGCAYAVLAVTVRGHGSPSSSLTLPLPGGRLVPESDSDGDGQGDDWHKEWSDRGGYSLQSPTDVDGDGLDTLGEYRWQLVPICVPSFENCRDHEADPATGLGGDGWLDGPETAYWDDPSNDGDPSSRLHYAGKDPDSALDSDGDGAPNVSDADSDNDTLLDGPEFYSGSYPEFADSDCATAPCTPATQSSYHDAKRQGHPGTGDAMPDGLERQAWDTLGPDAWRTDHDGDGVANNLLDPDADNDGLLDGQEFRLGAGQVRPDRADTDHDGVRDGDEKAWSVDSDGDGLLNAADPDSDDDGMPDGWEEAHHLDMLDPSDALLDRDGDRLSNLGEYRHGTDPDDMDSENDLLLDGEEVDTYHTNPLHWDTDRDGMPDRYEALYGLDPTSDDRHGNPDGDNFDRNGDGNPEQWWDNLQEYQYKRPASYDEAAQGPWLLGTHPKDPDTDKDGAPDGYEVYYGTDPTVPADANADTDQDGLNWTMEVRHGTDPDDPDTDRDGLCDGGRAANCHATPGDGGLQPGEGDYGSVPWMTDSDGDGLSDPAEARLWDPTHSGAAPDGDGDGLNGLVDADSDNDGLKDALEANALHTDPGLADTDHDGLDDNREADPHIVSPGDVRAIARWAACHSDPLKPDSDGDALPDGQEVDQLHTCPGRPDTDFDGLGDPDEVQRHTDPNLWDTDRDHVGDGTEVQYGTDPRVDDMALDLDQDGLSNGDEYHPMRTEYGWVVSEPWAMTNPGNADTDGDGMADGWEKANHDRFLWSDFNPAVPGAAIDSDGDGLSNPEESQAGTDPMAASSDGGWTQGGYTLTRDDLPDGDEVHTYHTDPNNPDSDGDGMVDGNTYQGYINGLWVWTGELQHWQGLAGASVWTDYDGDGSFNNLLDDDSDGDRLDDHVEFNLGTRPDMADTDGDGLGDWDEVWTYHGRFDPRMYDTDGNGVSDGEELVPNAQGDDDHDQLSNLEESRHGTDPNNPDSDCDGVQDGPEANYWGATWNQDGNRLLNADADGDGLVDGLEIGWMGTPKKALYHTDPAAADTDWDGLPDGLEDRNGFAVRCGGAVDSAAPMLPGGSAGEPVPSVSGLSALLGNALPPAPIHIDAVSATPLDAAPPQLTQGPDGLMVGSDDGGTYVQGGFGVKLYLAPGTTLEEALHPSLGDAGLPSAPTASPSAAPMAAPAPAYRTNPMKWDSDGDGLSDGQEASGGGNPAQPPTNPTACDTDGDGLGDLLELGIQGRTGNPNDPCTHRDSNTGNRRTDPTRSDTDGDGIPDGIEDASKDGDVGITWSPDGYCRIAGETDPADADTDDDGVSDLIELNSPKAGPAMQPFCFDTDRDGLSDGLEQGVTSPLADTLTTHTIQVGGVAWPTWQPFQGDFIGSHAVTTTVDDPDSDDDGIPDGLEDLNHNGKWGFDDAPGKPGHHDATNGLEDLNPTNPDSDGDNMLDGRELLIYSPTAGKDIQVDFPHIMATPGFSLDKMRFDPGNPWVIDPRSADTDGDGAKDGADLNPRADALLGLKFPEFQMLEVPDFTVSGQDDWNVELFFDDIRVVLPITDMPFELQMKETDSVSVYSRDVTTVPNLLIENAAKDNGNLPSKPSTLGTLWKVKQLADDPRVLAFNIPETPPTSADLKSLAITVTLNAMDEDAVNNDRIDLDSRKGASAAVLQIKLGDDATGDLNPDNVQNGYLVDQGTDWDFRGKDENVNDEAGYLRIKAGDTIPRFFLQALEHINSGGQSGLPDGDCQGAASCVH
jgi:hypothetical protein